MLDSTVINRALKMPLALRLRLAHLLTESLINDPEMRALIDGYPDAEQGLADASGELRVLRASLAVHENALAAQAEQRVTAGAGA